MRSVKLGIQAFTVVGVVCFSMIEQPLLHTSTWKGWEENTARWSSYEAPTFSAVFRPESEDELSQGVSSRPVLCHVARQLLKFSRLHQMQYFATHGIPYLATKPGGHGNVPTLGSYQNVVQINLDNFRHAVVNPDHSITVGGGAKMMDLIPTLHAAGREMSE